MANETEPAGATPGDDVSGLLRPELQNRADRDAIELEEIDRTYRKYVFNTRRRDLKPGWFSDPFIREVHREMFGTIWDWAGRYRTVELNIGIAWRLIPEQIQQLCGDFKHWISVDSSMDTIEIAARLQHRLTWMHPFKNGNGRHARLMTDIFFRSRSHAIPQWPQIQLVTHGEEIRERYIAAMKAADRGEFGALIALFNAWLEA
jgi:Fic-DOC domain mobile mystery protein B